MSQTPKNEYQTYLASDHWKRTKEMHFQKEHNRKCCLCGTDESLHVHHKFYKQKGVGSVLGREQEVKGLLCTLCANCHYLWHKHQTIHRRFGTTLAKPNTKYQKRVWFLLQQGLSIEQAIKNCRGYDFIKKHYALKGKKPKKNFKDRALKHSTPINSPETLLTET